MKKFAPFAALLAGLLSFSCQSVANSVNSSLKTLGLSSSSSQATVAKAVDVVEDVAPDIKKALEEITPEQEYYIGRAVGATVFAQYKAYDKAALNLYLNKLGQSLALSSERPEIFGGYRFVALDSQEINAFATPSGLVMVSRGLIGITTSEDELAAVLAHEISHITSKHGLKSIKSARFGQAIGTLAKKGTELVGEELGQVTGAFKDSIGDITKTMISSGYSKSAEFDADFKAVKLLDVAGYDPRALERVLKAMEKKLDPKAKDFSKTHPKPADRINVLKKTLDALKVKASAPTAARSERFAVAMKNL